MKTLHLAIIVTISLGLFAVSHAAFAENTATFAKIDVTYHPSTNVLDITGIVYKTFSQNYVLTIFNPQGHLITVAQLQLSQDDTFSQSIVTSSALWSEPGNYTVKVASGPQVLSEKLFYFTGASCCATNSHGIQAALSETMNVIDSPLKQFRSGTAVNDVVCRADLKLVVRSEDGYPACVTPDTAQKLIKRGWAKDTNSSNLAEGSTSLPITTWGSQETFDHAKSLPDMSWISLPTKVPPNLTLAPIRVKTDSAVTIISAIYTPPGVSTSDNVTGDQVANAGGLSVTYWKQIGAPQANLIRQMEAVAKEFPNTTSLDTINGHQTLILPNEIQINAGNCMGKTNCSLMIDVGSRTLNSTELRPIAESITILPHN